MRIRTLERFFLFIETDWQTKRLPDTFPLFKFGCVSQAYTYQLNLLLNGFARTASEILREIL